MNYWWVNQTDNWQDEFKRGYIYAGRSSHAYRKSILVVRKDDLVICTHGKGDTRKIYALGIVASDPSGEIVPRRVTRIVNQGKKPAWPEGWEVPIDYDELDHPVLWAPIRRRLQGNVVAKHFTNKSAGVQGYLFPVPPEVAGEVLLLINGSQARGFRLATPDMTPPEIIATAIAAEVMIRLGHQKWATTVKSMWRDRCCVAGSDIKRLLRASHIVSWSEDEICRLDPYNGLCLSPTYDAAFDAHMITFQDDGCVLLGHELSMESAVQIGIDPAARIAGLLPGHLKYLKRHRAVFRSKCQRP